MLANRMPGHGNEAELNTTISSTMQGSNNPDHIFDQIIRLNRACNQSFFLNGLNHMINNSINSILLGGELLQRYVLDMDSLFDTLENEAGQLSGAAREIKDNIQASMPQIVHGINSSARMLNMLVSHIREITDNGRTGTNRDVDLNQLASLCASMTEHRIRAFTDHFRLELESDLPALPGNAQQILQVILSLLSNALLSLPERSCAVVLSTSSNPGTGQVRLCIRDEGAGISPEVFPQITEPFFTTWQGRGCMGLGLTVADRVIRKHGGNMSVDTEPGKGTSVLVSLPVHAKASASKSERNHG